MLLFLICEKQVLKSNYKSPDFFCKAQPEISKYLEILLTE